MHQSLPLVKRQWSHGTFRRFCYLNIFFSAGVRSGSCYRPRLVYNVSSKDLAYAFKQERMASFLEKYIDAPSHTTPGQTMVSSLKQTIRHCSKCSKLHITITSCYVSGAPNENIVQNHLNIALLNVFYYLNGRYRHIFIP